MEIYPEESVMRDLYKETIEINQRDLSRVIYSVIYTFDLSREICPKRSVYSNMSKDICGVTERSFCLERSVCREICPEGSAQSDLSKEIC